MESPKEQKPYSAPVLVAHGSLFDLTLSSTTGSNSDGPSGMMMFG